MFIPASHFSSFPRLAFSGSRLSGSSAVRSFQQLRPCFSSFSGSVGVGCASGLDQSVRVAFPSALVFRVQPPVSRSAFAQRSARLVSWCASGSGLLVAFPVGSCPSSVRPSHSFFGAGSGTWGSVALAVGLGCSVCVVLPSPVGYPFPAPVSLARHFVCAGAAPCGGSFWLSKI